MAHYASKTTYSATERFMAGFGGLFGQMAARMAHHRVYRKTLNELRGLSDRDLQDLGMNRSTLTSVAREAADAKVRLKG